MTRRIPLRVLIVLLAVAVASLAVLAEGTSMSAFTGALKNTTNTVSLPMFTCQAAELADQPTRMYSLARDGGLKNQGSLGGEADALTRGKTRHVADSGCSRDEKSSLYLEPGLLGSWDPLDAGWVTTSDTTHITGSSAITQEVWFKTTSTDELIMGFGNNQDTVDGSSKKLLAVLLTPAGRIDFGTYNNTVNHELLTPAGTSYANDAWHHVVAVYDAGQKSLYVDGTLQGAGFGPSESWSGLYWRLGNDDISGWDNGTTNETFLTGDLQYAAVYPKALTATQVKAHYAAGRPF